MSDLTIVPDSNLHRGFSLHAAAQSVNAARQNLKTAQEKCSESDDYAQLFRIENELLRCQKILQKLANDFAGTHE